MKHRAILFAATLMACVSAWASPVDAERARTVAETFMRAQGMRGTAALTDISAAAGLQSLYVFAAEEGGFVVVSGDDAVQPILGYSLQSRFMPNGGGLHPNVRSWFDACEAQIGSATLNGLAADDETAGLWRQLEKGIAPQPPLTTSVDQLMTTIWNQYPYYNDSCPYDSTAGEHAVTGCVATATAQVMKKWNHPATGYGSHSYTHTDFGTLSADFGSTTYQWANMPNELTAASSNAQIGAVAQLMYHIGVALEMDYGVVESATYHPSVDLVQYFKYNPLLYTAMRTLYSTDEWRALLRSELDAGHPVIYSGNGGPNTGAHAFVCDGYDENNLFHINWGWGGYCDGYFSVDQLTPQGAGAGASAANNYTFNAWATIGMTPNTAFGTAGSISATGGAGAAATAVSGTGAYSIGSSVEIKAHAAEGYRFKQWGDYNRTNPRSIKAMGGDIGLTAQYEPLQGDRLGYVADKSINRYSINPSYWGIRLPASVLTAGHSLRAVRLYISNAGSYDIDILGGATAPDSLLASKSHTFGAQDEGGWHTVVFDTAVAVDATMPLWIRIHTTASGWSAAVTDYSGNPDGSLYGSALAQSYPDASFMIEGVFGSADSVTITANADTASHGTVYGGGTYAVGSTVTITATPAAGYSFLSWRDGVFDNPRTVTAMTDTTYTATFLADPCAIVSFPWNEGFEGVTGNCWDYSHTNGYGGFIPYANGNQAHTGNSILWGSYDDDGDIDAWAITPAFSLPATATTITFTWWVKGSIYANLPTSYQVRLSNSGPEPANFTTQLYTETTSSADNGQWRQRTANLSAYAGQTIRLAIRNTSVQGGNVILFDDLSLTATGSGPAPQYTITVAVNDTTMGSVVGGGTFTVGTQTTITATANTGYAFSQWQDGNTSNPRVVTVSADATYTAYFVEEGTVIDPCAVIVFPWSEDFENIDNLGCWSVASGNNYGNFVYSSNAEYAHGGSHCMAGAYSDDGDVDEWLLLPDMVLPANATDFELSWYAMGTVYDGIPTVYSVMLAPAGAEQLADYSTTLYTETTAQADFGTYRHHAVSLAAYAGQTIRIAFRNTTAAGGNTMFLDDMRIGQHEEEPPAQYTITVKANNNSWGTVSGGGTYDEGSTVTISATPRSGYRFVKWQDNNTQATRTITVTNNATYTAYFQSTQGIDDVDLGDLSIRAEHGAILIEGASAETVEVFAIDGRTVAEGTMSRIEVPTGVYMVRVAGGAAHKVVVTR